jgi:hypothetical protein
MTFVFYVEKCTNFSIEFFRLDGNSVSLMSPNISIVYKATVTHGTASRKDKEEKDSQSILIHIQNIFRS